MRDEACYLRPPGWAVALAPYLLRPRLRSFTPAVSSVPRTMWYFTEGRSGTAPPRTSTTECSWRLWPMPGMYAVTSIWFVRRTRAILRRAEFGFLGVIVRTCRHTPRFCGAPGIGTWRWRRLFQFLRMAGALILPILARRPWRTSWLIVGTKTEPRLLMMVNRWRGGEHRRRCMPGSLGPAARRRSLSIGRSECQTCATGESPSGRPLRNCARPPVRGAKLRSMDTPEVRYVKTPDGAHLAYQVFGDGAFDLVFVPGFASNVEHMWRIEPFARGLRRLGSFARVVVFDRRGTGLSDRLESSAPPTLEAQMDDIRAVMDAAAVERAALFGFEIGANLCAVYAAAQPSRVFACVLHGSVARGERSPDYPWGWTSDRWDAYLDEIDQFWGTQEMSDRYAHEGYPSHAADGTFRKGIAS